MSTRKLEEILEECLSAYLEGRRSIEECLSLYPASASELEPLLRTATSINRIQSYQPPAHIQQRGLHRFLSDARSRRNLRTMVRASGPARTNTGRGAGIMATLWGQYRISLGAASLAIVVAAVAIGAAAFSGGGGGNNGSGFVVNPSSGSASDAPSTPVQVLTLKNQIQSLRSRIDNGEQLSTTDVETLKDATQKLRGVSSDDVELDDLEDTLNEANKIANDIAVKQPELATAAADTSEVIRSVASDKGIPLAPITPTPAAVTDAPTPNGEPTVPPVTPTAAPPTTAPAQAPTDTPTPIPTSQAQPTTDVRLPQGP